MGESALFPARGTAAARAGLPVARGGAIIGTDFRKGAVRMENGRRAEGSASGIGLLNERSLHAFLKEYYEPDPVRREVAVGRLVADIRNGEGITEIQTGGFTPLRRKLPRLLEEDRVTVVYPVAQTKWIVWVDPDTGETTKPRKSPRTGTAYDIFAQLVYLGDLFRAYPERLYFRIVLLELTEYRSLCGWSRDRKKGSARIDRVVGKVLREQTVASPRGFGAFVCPQLPERFTAKDFAAAAAIPLRLAQKALRVLVLAGAVRRAGKQRNAFIYERN